MTITITDLPTVKVKRLQIHNNGFLMADITIDDNIISNNGKDQLDNVPNQIKQETIDLLYQVYKILNEQIS